MTRPWKTVDSVDTEEGALELRQRGSREFLIAVAGRVLMNSAASRSEVALARGAGAPTWLDRAWEAALLGGFRWKWRLRGSG